jgi:hypothetical protein
MSDTLILDWLHDGLQRVQDALRKLRPQRDVVRMESELERLAEAGEHGVDKAPELIAACEAFPGHMQWLWRNVWESASRVPGTSSNSLGAALRDIFDQTIRLMESVRAGLRTVQGQAACPSGQDRLDRALGEARQFRADLETNWLWFTREADEEAKASIARGEGVDVEEAFAQMAGISMDELRARVEAHKKQYHSNGDGAR